jgi:hypothetical protein
MDRYEKALEPFTKGRAIDWEIQIEDCDVSTIPSMVCSFGTLIMLIQCSEFFGTKMG